MANNKIALWRYLLDNRVMIPILQRDYAQGRPDKGPLRKNFLASLKKAMDDNLLDGGHMILDFIYGSVENETMLPLDGQQRITTLWLLHWYVALRAGKLEEARKGLENFTYETRRSSRYFCKNICNPECFKGLSRDDNIYDYITTSTWFAASWLNDPTIISMLRMITGTVIDIDKVEKNRRKEAEDANALVDGLEKIFKQTTYEQFRTYWQSMTSDNPPFYFYQLPLLEFGLSDDLYVKMNARGKQLTPFENFKADLIGYLRQRAKEQDEPTSSNKPDSDKDWKKLLDPRSGIPIMLDTEWTKLFWKNRSSKNSIDEIFFAFINRVFWEELIAGRDCSDISDDDEGSIKALEENSSYRFLNTDNVEDYHDLTPYRFKNGEIPYSLFENLTSVLARLIKVGNFDAMKLPRNIGDEFHFIPIYTEETNRKGLISRLTQPHRVIFHAIYKYLLEGEVENISLKRWMRLVCNITSGKSLGSDWNRYIIRTTATMLSAIRTLSSIDSHQCYESLFKRDIIKSDKEIPSRMNEEITKVKMILETPYRLAKYFDNLEYETWEEAITAAENYAFFNGSIRFLYQNNSGQADFKDFNKKFAKAKEYFKPICTDSCNVVNPTFSGNATLLQSLISRFDTGQFDNVIWWRRYYIFDNSEQSWRHYLYNENICEPIHKFLTEKLAVKIRVDSQKGAKHILYLLSNTGLLNYAMKKFGNSYIRIYHGHDAIYPSATGIFLDTAYRDSFMSQTNVVMRTGEKVPDSNLLYGSDISFTYAGNNYIWHRDNRVYLAKSDNYEEYETLLIDGEKNYIYITPNNMEYEDLENELKALPEKFAQRKTQLETTVIQLQEK